MSKPMQPLHDVSRSAPKGEALVRIFKCGQLSLNFSAKQLLGLQDDSKVVFRLGEEGPEGTMKVYIGRRSYSAYPLLPRGNCYRICSTRLCQCLAAALQGYGTYRIEAESRETDFSGNTYYQLFFKRYDH